jgi:putative transposase
MPHTYPSRQSLRLQDYDYSQAGMYFVTICTAERTCILGTLDEDLVEMTGVGLMVSDAWSALPSTYPGVEIDAFVVMPNHVHGIVVLTGAPREVRRGGLTLRCRCRRPYIVSSHLRHRSTAP